jgi:hypothetical protein
MDKGSPPSIVDPSIASSFTELARLLRAQQETRRLEGKIEAALKQHGFPYQRQPQYGSVRPDFLVLTPWGKQFVIEAKTWPDTAANRHVAGRQPKLLKEATGADGALVVTEHLAGPLPAGVLDLHGFSKTLVSWQKRGKRVSKKGGRRGTRWNAGAPPLRAKREAGKKFIFAAMPFAPEFEDTYLAAMVPAAGDNDMDCYRVDYEDFNGDVVGHIRTQIQDSAAVIADLSYAKPNVLYEAGYAHALGKPTVHVSSTPLADLPFDVRNWNTMSYKVGQTTKLRTPLSERLKATLH